MKNLVDNVHYRVYDDMKTCLNKEKRVLLFFSPLILRTVVSKLNETLKR